MLYYIIWSLHINVHPIIQTNLLKFPTSKVFFRTRWEWRPLLTSFLSFFFTWKHSQYVCASRLTECRCWIVTFLFSCQNLSLPIAAGFSVEEIKEITLGPLTFYHGKQRLNCDKTHQRESRCKITAARFFQSQAMMCDCRCAEMASLSAF